MFEKRKCVDINWINIAAKVNNEDYGNDLM